MAGRLVSSWALAQGSTRQWLRLLCGRRDVVSSWALAQGSTTDRCGSREWWTTADHLAPAEPLLRTVPEPGSNRLMVCWG